MQVRFIVRLTNHAHELLAWAEVYATARPQGRPRSTPFFADGVTKFLVERSGVASRVSIHWVDLDLVRIGPEMQAVVVQAGQVFDFTWLGPVWMIEGSHEDIPLEAVTVRGPVAVSIPLGGMGVAS